MHRMVRFLCVGDVHGHTIQVPQGVRFDAILAVGDFCEHSLRSVKFEALARKLAGDPVKWYDLLGRKEALRRIEASVASGSEVLAHLDSFGVPVFVVPGNWDWTAEDSEWDALSLDRFSDMIASFPNVRSIDDELVGFGGVSLVGYGVVSEPELPFEKREKLSEEEWAECETSYAHLKERFEQLLGQTRSPLVLLAHAPPYGTVLDAIDRPDSPRHGMHVGSLLVRDLIVEHDVLACLCGHMHENPGRIELEGTPVVNLGFGADAWCVFDSDSGVFEGLDRVRRARE